MPNPEILGGLKSALNKGESLEKAMTSLYNAGYMKEEIEEAARFLQSPEQIQPAKKPEALNTSIKSTPKKVSEYGAEKPKSNPVKKAAKGIVIAIIIAAILFVGLLIAFLITT